MAYRLGLPGQPHADYHSSHTYMWTSKDKLGQGATGQVFVGYNKKTGDKVAVKMFTRMSEFRAMQNEMHTISQLQHHKNIVQFLEINEQEKASNINIIVMELCNGGSLYEVIDSPENAMGLDEVQFKRVVSDVAQGLSHLKKHGFAHRDIKPGNIMRCLLPDGSYVFKLADFGTARKLGPEEKFTSLHGTEEYLYPAMYERALIDPRSQEAFVDKVDLWSVGATFFHLATGRLPFQAYRKRDDRATMYRIITEKKSGVILGWQMELNGQIFYSKELPPDIILSVGLRNVIIPVLAGLLENNFEVMWTFNKFFREVERIFNMKVVDVFCVSRCTCHKIYLDPRETDVMPKVRELISQQTRLDPVHMEFYFENIPYAPHGPVKTGDLPDTSPDSPLTVFGGPPQKGDQLETPVLTRAPTMPPEVSIVDDLRYSKDCTKAVWGYYHSAETVERYFRLMHQAALCLRETVQKEHKSWKQKFDEVSNLYESIMKLTQGQISELHSEITLARTTASDADIQYIETELMKKKNLLAKIQLERHELDKQREEFNPQIMHLLNASSWDSNYLVEVFNGSIKTMKFYVDTIQEIFHQFQEQKKKGGPQSNYDKKVHEYNKKTIKDRLAEAETRLMRMIQGRSNVYNRLYEFLQKCILVREDMQSFTISLEHNIKHIHELISNLTEWAETHQQRMQHAAQRLKTSSTPTSSSKDYSSILKLIQDLNVLTSSNLKLTEEQKQYFKNQ